MMAGERISSQIVPESFLWKPGDAPVGLYLHVPFCRAICSYCAFAKGEYAAGLAERWLDATAAEIDYRSRNTWNGRPVVDTVFLGGGTPSTLTPDQWRRLGEILAAGFVFAPGVEFTSEANPESFTPETAAAMRDAGINRLSMGVQSLDPGELRMLGRIHDADRVGLAVRTAREHGFGNLNLDLMYGLPGQTVAVFRRSLLGVLDLEPEHVSAYCLGLEPGTDLERRVREGAVPGPEDDAAADQYRVLEEELARRGYAGYEISNFAREGRECRHNLRYWTRTDAIGLGPSAHALLGNHRWVNPAPLESWIRAYAPGGEPPAPREVPQPLARFEWVFLNLRLTRGIDMAAFHARWGTSFEEAYGEVAGRLVRGGMLEEASGFLRLTPRARFVSDAVFAEFAP